MKKITKYLLLVILGILIMIYICKNFFSVKKPFENFNSQDLKSIDITEFNPGKDNFFRQKEITDKEKNKKILEYFKSLKLKKSSINKYYSNMKTKTKDETRILITFKFDKKVIFISDLFLKEPDYFFISIFNIEKLENKDKTHSIYYKILKNKIDYDYINKIIKGEV